MLINGEVQPGSFNLLNTPDSLYEMLGPDKFWQQINKPFLNAAIARGDDIVLATKPDFRPFSPNPGESGNMLGRDGALTGFGREVDYLIRKGYVYQPATGRMQMP